MVYHLYYKSTKSQLPEISTYGVIFLIASIFTGAFSACLVHGSRTVGFDFIFQSILLTNIPNPAILFHLYFRGTSAS